MPWWRATATSKRAFFSPGNAGPGIGFSGLLAEWERAHPERKPWGEHADELPEWRARGEWILEALRIGHPQVTGADRLIGRVRGELDHTLRGMEHGVVEATRERVAGLTGNLGGVWAEWRSAVERAADGPVEVARQFDYIGEMGGRARLVDVDVIADGGRLWVEVKNRRPFTTESSAWAEFEPQAAKLLRAAGQHPVNGLAPRIAVEFRRGVSPSVTEALRAMDIEVVGARRVERISEERTWDL